MFETFQCLELCRIFTALSLSFSNPSRAKTNKNNSTLKSQTLCTCPRTAHVMNSLCLLFLFLLGRETPTQSLKTQDTTLDQSTAAYQGTRQQYTRTSSVFMHLVGWPVSSGYQFPTSNTHSRPVGKTNVLLGRPKVN